MDMMACMKQCDGRAAIHKYAYGTDELLASPVLKSFVLGYTAQCCLLPDVHHLFIEVLFNILMRAVGFVS